MGDLSKIAELIFIGRIDRAIRRAIRDEKHYCPKCGEPTYYEPHDSVYLHVRHGGYFCEGDR